MAYAVRLDGLGAAVSCQRYGGGHGDPFDGLLDFICPKPPLEPAEHLRVTAGRSQPVTGVGNESLLDHAGELTAFSTPIGRSPPGPLAQKVAARGGH
jgi:hypothetical protein